MGGKRADATRIAEAVRAACIEAALQAYEDAGLSGLCVEGRWECAIEAIRGLDLSPHLPMPPPDAAGTRVEADPKPPAGPEAAERHAAIRR